MVVQHGFTVRSEPGIVQVPLGGLLVERHCQMNQADTRSIGANDAWSYGSFRFGFTQVRFGLLKLVA